ncbi:MAG: monovalent cation/H+ antiporter complex subunit F [Aggregatilineales bacterium]
MEVLLNVAVVTIVLLMLPCGWRAWRGPTVADRLLAIDLMATLFAGVMVVFALLFDQAIFVDVALAIGALSFISTVGISRFLAEGKVF